LFRGAKHGGSTVNRALESLVDEALDHRQAAAARRIARTAPPTAASPLACTCLVVGGQSALTRRLMTGLPRFGVRPVMVSDAHSITRFVRKWRFDAIVVDARERDDARPALLHALAGLTAAPVLLLSSRADEDGVIVDLEHGATDVLPADASPQLVATKIKRLVSIAAGSPAGPGRATEAPPSTLQLGALRLDLQNQQGSVNGVLLDVTGRAFAVLAMLAERAHTIVDRTSLSLQLGAPGKVRSRAFDLQISRIRAALAQAGAHDVVIETVYRRGYRLALHSLAPA
jgi:DNA-binding response OmpR family regulator